MIITAMILGCTPADKPAYNQRTSEFIQWLLSAESNAYLAATSNTEIYFHEDLGEAMERAAKDEVIISEEVPAQEYLKDLKDEQNIPLFGAHELPEDVFSHNR